MIKKIGVQNFRVFKDYTEFEIRPITLLVGPNNSGKSSFTKLLRLVENGFEFLDFNKGKHNLKDFKSSINHSSGSQEMIISTIPNVTFLGPENKVVYTYKENKIKTTQIYLGSSLVFTKEQDFNSSDAGSRVAVSYSNMHFYFDFNVLIDFIYRKEFYIKHIDENGNEKANVNYNYLFELKRKSYAKELNKIHNLTNINVKDYNELCKNLIGDNPSFNYNELRWQAIYNEIDNLEKDYVLFDIYSNGNRVTENFKEIIIKSQNDYNNHVIKPSWSIFINNNVDKFSEWVIENIKETILKELTTTLPDLEIQYSSLGKLVFQYQYYNNKNEKSSLFHSIIKSKTNHTAFKDLRYLSPIKSHNNRIFENNSSFALDSLIHNHHHIINHFIIGKKNESFIQKALKIFGIQGELEINIYEDYIATVNIKNGDKTTALNDLGYGYTQLLALALFLVSSYEFSPFGLEEGPISIIEEPEANLHPNLQSKIADLFDLFYKTFDDSKNHPFIIETHSEYLIRKFQYLVAKGELDPKNIIIYYFNDDQFVNKEEPKVKQIEITKSGSLSDTFGPGFYDEAIKLQFDLLNVNKEQNN